MSRVKADTGVQRLLALYPPQVRSLARQLRKLILETVPGLIEMVDTSAKLVGYGFGRRYRDLICTIILGKGGVSLGIARGADLPDPRQLLEGRGRVHRHIKFKAPADLRRPGIKPLLKAALAAWKQQSAADG